MFILGFMTTYYHAMPLLAAPKALEAIIGTSDNEKTAKWIRVRVSGSDKYMAN